MKRPLAEVIAELRQLGVTRYKDDEMEIELGPPPVRQFAQDDLKEHQAKAEVQERERRNRILFGASGIRPVQK